MQNKIITTTEIITIERKPTLDELITEYAETLADIQAEGKCIVKLESDSITIKPRSITYFSCKRKNRASTIKALWNYIEIDLIHFFSYLEEKKLFNNEQIVQFYEEYAWQADDQTTRVLAFHQRQINDLLRYYKNEQPHEQITVENTEIILSQELRIHNADTEMFFTILAKNLSADLKKAVFDFFAQFLSEQHSEYSFFTEIKNHSKQSFSFFMPKKDTVELSALEISAQIINNLKNIFLFLENKFTFTLEDRKNFLRVYLAAAKTNITTLTQNNPLLSKFINKNTTSI